MKISHFSVCRQLVQTPEKSDNVSCSNNAAPVIVHAIRVTRFPKKIKCKPCIHEKFSFFLLVGSLYKRLKNLTMFLALTMLIPVIVHAIRVTRFPKKIKCKPLYL